MIIRQPGNLGNFLAPRAPVYYEATTERNGIVESRSGDRRRDTEVAGLPDDLENGCHG